MFKISQDKEMLMIKMRSFETPMYCYFVEEESDGKPWYFDIKLYLKTREYPKTTSKNDKITMRRLASSFILNGDFLYKRNHDMVLLRCVDAREAGLILKEIHERAFGTNMNGHSMAKMILRAGYFLLTMENDCYMHVKKCEKC